MLDYFIVCLLVLTLGGEVELNPGPTRYANCVKLLVHILGGIPTRVWEA